MATILITGATGNIGTVLVDHLKKKYDLILVDIDFSDVPEELLEGTTVKKADLTKPENWEGLLKGVDYVIHLAGDPRPDAEFYDTLLDMNFKMPYNLFSEAVKEGNHVKRIIFASSVHAIQGYPENVQVKVSDYPRPADIYGVSKVYAEALASHFAYNYDQEAIGIRIGGFDSEIDPEIADADGLATHISKRDMCHLIDRCLEAELREPFMLVNGLSNNRFPRMDISQAYFDIGYQPQDDAFKLQGSGTWNFKEEPEVKVDPKENN